MSGSRDTRGYTARASRVAPNRLPARRQCPPIPTSSIRRQTPPAQARTPAARPPAPAPKPNGLQAISSGRNGTGRNPTAHCRPMSSPTARSRPSGRSGTEPNPPLRRRAPRPRRNPARRATSRGRPGLHNRSFQEARGASMRSDPPCGRARRPSGRIHPWAVRPRCRSSAHSRR